jgi:hypothetical protein
MGRNCRRWRCVFPEHRVSPWPYCDTAGDVCPGRCAPRFPTGQTVPKPQACAEGSVEWEGICRPLTFADRGESCAEPGTQCVKGDCGSTCLGWPANEGDQCAPFDFCADPRFSCSKAGTCVPLARLGERCEDRECQLGLACAANISSDDVLDFIRAPKFCDRPLRKGDLCSRFGPPCEATLSCSGSCRPLPTVCKPCSSPFGFTNQDGDFTITGGACGPGLICGTDALCHPYRMTRADSAFCELSDGRIATPPAETGSFGRPFTPTLTLEPCSSPVH